MYQNTGGRSSRGFWLSRYSLDSVDIDQKWQVANHEAIANYLTTTQCLILTSNLWPEYEEWAQYNGLDRRRGVGHGRLSLEARLLPPKRIINLNILGSEYPPQESWDYYNRYVGPNAPARSKARAAAPASAGGAAPVRPPEPKEPPKAAQQPKVPAPACSPNCVLQIKLYSSPSPVVSTNHRPPVRCQSNREGSLLPKSATQQ